MVENKTCKLKNKNSVKDNFLVMSEAHLKNLSNDIFEEVEFITPLAEATINSILSQKQDVYNEIIINLTKDNQHHAQGLPFENDDKFKIQTIEIIDKGVGFDKEHRESFNKLANSNNKNCRGLGRLSFLQVFNKIKYHSVFIEDGEYKEIDFCFDENFDKINEKDVKPSIEKTTGTILTFEDITKEFIDDENNVFSAEKILTRLLDDILPHLLQYNCKIIVDCGDQNKSEFSLFTTNDNWKDIENNITYKGQTFKIKYFLTDKLKQDYFYYLANGRAVKKIYGNNKIKFSLKDKDKKSHFIFIKVESEYFDSIVSADWKRLKHKNTKEWADTEEKIKSNIGNFIYHQLEHTKDEVIIQDIFNYAKNKAPYMATIIKNLQEQKPWIFVGGCSYIVETAEKELERSSKKVLEDKDCSEKDIEIVKQDGLNKLVMTKYNVLKQAVEKFNNVKSDEVKDIHKLLDDNLWLLDPKWEYADKIASEKSINTINNEINIFGLTPEENKNFNTRDIFDKHKLNYGVINNSDDFLKEFNKRPDICIFNNDSVIIVELKAPDVDLSLHIEKLKYYASLISFLNEDKYKRFYCYLVGKTRPDITDTNYVYTNDYEGLFTTNPEMRISCKDTIFEGGKPYKTLNSSMYYEICTYNKFLKDCYFLYHPFFKELKVKIDALEKYIPENKR